MSGRTTKRPRLIAVDLDGTLLDLRGNPHEIDVRALRAAADAGVVVSIITGRLYSGTRAAAERLGIRGPVGCADGSHVVHTETHKTLVHHGIRGEHASRLRTSLLRHGATGFLFAADAIVHDDAGEMFLGYMRTWSHDVRRAERLGEHELWDHEDGITGIAALGKKEPIERTHAEIVDGLGGHAQAAKFEIKQVPGLWGMIARSTGGTKATALEWIATHHGLTLDETTCVGDWLNDVPMLQAAGRSFAMGQAPDAVKHAATDVLPETSATGGGIARVVRDVFGVEF